MQMLSAPLQIDSEGKPYIERPTKARKQGEFYTPSWLVDYCFEQVRGSGDDREFSILDPACGTGNFLLGALRQCETFAASDLIRFAGTCLFGFDTDPRAVDLAIAAITIALSGKLTANAVEPLACSLGKNIVVQDATLPLPPDRFDLVIGNPPYISYGARNQPPMLAGVSTYLRKQFPSSSEYKIRLHSIFQEIAIRQAKPGGQVILLVPDAFLTGAYYANLRKLIASETNIVSLSELQESTFDDATAGRWCVAHYRKNSGGGQTQESATQLYQLGEQHQVLQQFSLRQIQLISNDKHRFQLVFNHRDATLLERFAELPPVRSSYRGYTGIRARAGQATIVSPKPKGASWKRGLTSGACVNRHSVQWDGMWLDITPAKLFGGGHDARVVEGMKLLVRQTADRLIGGIDTSGLYHLNNVHSFAPVSEQTPSSMHLFAALLNSNLWLYLYHLKSRECGRALAQIDIEMVEAMPLPLQKNGIESALCHLSQALRQGQTKDRSVVERAIDRLVYDLYILDEEDVSHIENSTAASRLKTTAGTPLPSSEAAMKLVESLRSVSAEA